MPVTATHNFSYYTVGFRMVNKDIARIINLSYTHFEGIPGYTLRFEVYAYCRRGPREDNWNLA